MYFLSFLTIITYLFIIYLFRWMEFRRQSELCEMSLFMPYLYFSGKRQMFRMWRTKKKQRKNWWKMSVQNRIFWCWFRCLFENKIIIFNPRPKNLCQLVMGFLNKSKYFDVGSGKFYCWSNLKSSASFRRFKFGRKFVFRNFFITKRIQYLSLRFVWWI